MKRPFINQGTTAALAVADWEPSFDMTIDRIEGTWVVMAWTTNDDDEDVTLRLRIDHPFEAATDLFRFDVQAGGDFVQVGEARSCLCDLAFGEGAVLFADDGAPTVWREEFREMARRWAIVTYVLDPMDDYETQLPAAILPEGNAAGPATSSAVGGR